MVTSDADPQLNTGLTPGIKTLPEELSLTKIKYTIILLMYRNTPALLYTEASH